MRAVVPGARGDDPITHVRFRMVVIDPNVEVQVSHQKIGALFGPDGWLRPEVDVLASWVFLYPAQRLALPGTPAAGRV